MNSEQSIDNLKLLTEIQDPIYIASVMNSQNESRKPERQFLEIMACHYSFSGKRWDVFLNRFDLDNAGKNNKAIAESLWTKEEGLNQGQAFQYHLKAICDALAKDVCPIGQSNEPGRPLKGESPWEQAHKWLWETKFKDREKGQGSNDSSASVIASDWQDYCRRMLPTGLSTNPFLSGDGVMLTVEDIVPLELVECKRQPQHERDFSPELFQTQAPAKNEVPIAHNQFFEQVLENRSSPKSQGRKIAIIGEPGAGKTTLLQEIASWVDYRGGLPIFVNLADLQGKNLEDYLLGNWLKRAICEQRVPQDIEDDFVKQFNKGRVWLLLDGLDEMAEPSHLLSSVDEYLKGWVANARIVLTCRLNVWNADKNALYN